MIEDFKLVETVRAAHAGQFRRWPKEPYVFHVARVAGITRAHGVNAVLPRSQPQIGVEESGLGAAYRIAYLHDVMEDCEGWDYNKISNYFGYVVAEGVLALTKNKGEGFYSYINRVASSPRHVRQIKLIDRADNLAGPFPMYSREGFDFVAKYIPETKLILHHLAGTDAVLEQIVTDKLAIVTALFDQAEAARYPDPSRD